MLRAIIPHLGTIVVSLVLLAIVISIVRKLVRDRKKGGCASCDGCPGHCHLPPDGSKK